MNALIKLNKKLCGDPLYARCDLLDQNPGNYAGVFVISVLFTVMIPMLTAYLLWTSTWGSMLTVDFLTLFSPIIPGITMIYLGLLNGATSVMFVLLLIIDAIYFIFMMKHVGMFIFLAVIAETVKFIIVLFLTDYMIFAIIISLVPWVPLAIITHFTIYTFFHV